MGPQCFLFKPTKKFSFQNGKKTEGRNWASFLDENAHVQLHIGFVHVALLHFFFPFLLVVASSSSSSFFHFSFDLLGRLRLVLIFFSFLFLSFFAFFCVLCVCVCVFHFNWASFFNKSICVNLYKLTFSIPLLFHSQPNKNKGNWNLFYPPTFPSSYNFFSSHFFISPTKRTLKIFCVIVIGFMNLQCITLDLHWTEETLVYFTHSIHILPPPKFLILFRKLNYLRKHTLLYCFLNIKINFFKITLKESYLNFLFFKTKLSIILSIKYKFFWQIHTLHLNILILTKNIKYKIHQLKYFQRKFWIKVLSINLSL